MSCAPTYTYRPTFVPSGVDCTLPTYNRHRARTTAGGTYFRSKEQSSSWNDITIKVELIGAEHVLTVMHPDYTTETFSVEQVASLIDPLTLPCSPGIAELRTLVNRPVTGIPATSGSAMIEMPERGADIEFDAAGVDALCLSEFTTVNLSGGEGGPTSAAALAGIRTGPERSVIRISTEEAYDGTPVDPPQARRVQQWNGTAWVEYSNAIPGACPV